MLCTCIGILRQGRLSRIGTVERLRDVIGRPYSMNVLVRDMPAIKLESLVQFVEGTFAGCVLTARHTAHLSFQIPYKEMKWPKLFRSIKQITLAFSIDGFLIGSATLGEIFVRVARVSNPEQ